MGLPALIADYLFLAPLIQARLADQVKDIPVEVVETVNQVYAADKRVQVLMVMWAGDRFAETEPGRAAGGTSQKVLQRWMVLLALSDAHSGKDARQRRAGNLLSEVHKALAGWKPEGAVHPLLRANAPLRPDINATKALYPLGFEIQLSL